MSRAGRPKAGPVLTDAQQVQILRYQMEHSMSTHKLALAIGCNERQLRRVISYGVGVNDELRGKLFKQCGVEPCSIE